MINENVNGFNVLSSKKMLTVSSLNLQTLVSSHLYYITNARGIIASKKKRVSAKIEQRF